MAQSSLFQVLLVVMIPATALVSPEVLVNGPYSGSEHDSDKACQPHWTARGTVNGTLNLLSNLAIGRLVSRG